VTDDHRDAARGGEAVDGGRVAAPPLGSRVDAVGDHGGPIVGAARRIGLESVPLLCTREMVVPGSMERVIRAMVHYYAAADHQPAHAYLGAAQDLRSDLHSAQ